MTSGGSRGGINTTHLRLLVQLQGWPSINKDYPLAAVICVAHCVSSATSGLHLHMMQLILCCLFGLLLTQVSAVPPENCPDDHQLICRTDFRYRVSHDWIPYANASSGDGIRWRVLVDQHDYQNILGQFNIPPGVWKAVDADGDGLNVSTVTRIII